MIYVCIIYIYIYVCVCYLYLKIYIYIYGVVSRVNGPPPHDMGGGVGTRIRYTHCISTLCRLSTLPQYYKPPPHHRGGETTIPQTGGILYYHPPWGGRGGGTGQHCTIYIYIHTHYPPSQNLPFL